MNIYEKIAEVMRDISYLAKDDFVKTGGSSGYKAITEEKVTATVRESLINHKLVILPISQTHRREDERITDSYGKEKVNRVTTVDVLYRIVNTEKPDEYIDVASSGTGVDTQDKGVGKAMTYAYKYMLLRTFAIPTGDDADKVSSDAYSDKLYGKPSGTKKAPKDEQKGFQEVLDNVPLATAKQIEELRAGLKALGQSEEAFLKAKKIACFDEITEIAAGKMIAEMKKRIREKDGAA